MIEAGGADPRPAGPPAQVQHADAALRVRQAVVAGFAFVCDEQGALGVGEGEHVGQRTDPHPAEALAGGVEELDRARIGPVICLDGHGDETGLADGDAVWPAAEGRQVDTLDQRRRGRVGEVVDVEPVGLGVRREDTLAAGVERRDLGLPLAEGGRAADRSELDRLGGGCGRGGGRAGERAERDDRRERNPVHGREPRLSR